MEVISTKDCRSVYRELLQGYTYLEAENVYIKHFKEADLGFIEHAHKRCEDDLKSKGILTLTEKLDFLNENNYWTEQEEADYSQQVQAVADAHEFQKRLQNEEQKKMFQKTVDEQEAIFAKIQEERFKVVEPVVETFCSKRINEEYVRRALHKDEELKEPRYSKEEFESISYSDLAIIVKNYNSCMSKFVEENIKKICVNNFFLNAFMMADNDPVKFFGTSVLDLTIYQLNLFSRGKYYKFILEEGNPPPEGVQEQADNKGVEHLVNYYDLEYNRIKNERERKIGQMQAQSNMASRKSGITRK